MTYTKRGEQGFTDDAAHTLGVHDIHTGTLATRDLLVLGWSDHGYEFAVTDAPAKMTVWYGDHWDDAPEVVKGSVVVSPVGDSSNIVTLGNVAVATNVYTATMTEAVHILWAHIKYTSDAVAGQRWIRLGLLTGADVEIADWHSGAKQSQNNIFHYAFLSGIPRETAFTDDEIMCSLPHELHVPAGYKFHVEDAANISALDSMAVTYQYRKLK